MRSLKNECLNICVSKASMLGELYPKLLALFVQFCEQGTKRSSFPFFQPHTDCSRQNEKSNLTLHLKAELIIMDITGP
ncbi:hypothetical protein ADS79_17570 [Brevibacillus reuszeri]|uniref:Uncharacterized protein n=1 Tax=Brevibacillus reuszeri TaxID=54915 RepID=A0A0K9YPN7_9BACL|nr:hypothetical protein ADS79_17570 [Brevibacillus reuszeri]